MGIWVAIMPFLHFPVNVRNVIYVLTGLTIFIVSYLYLRKRMALSKDKVEPTFVESVPQKKKTHAPAHTSTEHKNDEEDIHSPQITQTQAIETTE
jgi:hypothetical protein